MCAARRLPDGAPIGSQPLAYLVDERELNDDNSNFWIFTETARGTNPPPLIRSSAGFRTFPSQL